MHAEAGHDRWWPAGAPTSTAPARLLCLPFAGGGASAFRSWRGAAGSLEVCPIQPPGREARIREEPFRRMDVLVEALLEVLRPRLFAPYALFGYSLGGLVAFEVARELARAGLPGPSALFVAACAPPHRKRREEPIHGLPDAEFKEALRALSGTPEAVLAHDELMDLVLPILRADFELYERYVAEGQAAAKERLAVPITAFGGTKDASVSLEDLEAWGDLAGGPFRTVTFPGDHFFLATHSRELLDRIVGALRPNGAP